jgi:hypothetical protein
MSINPLSSSEIQHLRQAMKFSYDRLQPFRRNQLTAIREMCGIHYSDNGAADKVPVNMLELAVNIYLQSLAAQTPQSVITAIPRKLKHIARSLEIDTNNTTTKMNLGEILQDVARQAMFSVGIAKKGLASYTEPFFAAVSLDNWVHDMCARTWGDMQYYGDRYQLTYDQVLASDYFTPEFRAKIAPNTNYKTSDEPEVKDISQGSGTTRERFRDVVTLWDIYLPYDKLLITLDGDGAIDDAGAVIEWDGPGDGPYDFLSFNKVLDNVMPLPPVALWRDMHDLLNRLFRKLGRQAERQKTITGVQAAADADGNRVLKADDGDMIKLDQPKNVQEYKYGGIDQASLAFAIQVKELASYMAGNLDALGGLARMSDTLGQDQLLNQSASKRLEWMQKITIAFATRSIKDIAWYRWTNPTEDYRIVKSAFGVDAITYLRAQDRTADFLEFNFQIDAYSLQHQTPAQRLSSITSIFERFIAPLAPMLQQQGTTVNFSALFELLGKYTNLPELKDLLVFQEPMEGESPDQQIRMPSNTTRRYIRENRPGATSQGKDAALMQTLLNGKPQRSEMASLMQSQG